LTSVLTCLCNKLTGLSLDSTIQAELTLYPEIQDD
jgi:hypothetical protein